MVTTEKLMAYFCLHYPEKHLSLSRLTKLVYLADWKSAMNGDGQLSEIQWRFSHYGPFVWDISDIANKSPQFRMINEEDNFGTEKNLITYTADNIELGLNEETIQVLDFIIKKTSRQNYSEFIKQVYATYPIIKSARHSNLDLIGLAQEYEEYNI